MTNNNEKDRIVELENEVKKLKAKIEAMEKQREDDLWYIQRDIKHLYRLHGL